MDNEMLEKRLDRFEEKLDKLGEAIMTVARIEERQAQTGKTLDRLFTQLSRLESRIGSLEQNQTENRTKLGIGERVWWMIAAAAIGFISFKVKS